MTIFGEIFGGDQIDAALISVLRTWMPTYLTELVRQGELEIELEAPRSYVAVSEFDRWPEEQLPAVTIVNPGIEAAPQKDGGGTFRARWPVEVCISVAGPDQPTTRRNSQLYIAAARGCIMQRRSLGAEMKGVDWAAESYELIDSEKRRTLAGAKASFVIERDQVITVGAGPTDPEAEPQPEEWPEVESVETDLEAEPIA